MARLVWANFPIVALFLIAYIGIPLWMTYKYRHQPDHSEAQAYQREKAKLERRSRRPAMIPVPGTPVAVKMHPSGARTMERNPHHQPQRDLPRIRG